MKITLLFLLSFALALAANGQITYDSTGTNRIATISGPNFAGGFINQANADPLFRFRVKSGWTVRVNGSASYAYMVFQDLNGAPAGIKITNINDQVRIVGDAIVLTRCRNVSLVGDLNGTRVYDPNSAVDTCYMGFVTDQTAKYNFVIEGLRTNTSLNPPGGRRDGFALEGTTSGDITFRQCFAKNASGTAFKDNQATSKDSIQFIDCRVEGAVFEGIYCGPTSGAAIVVNFVRIERCRISNVYNNGVQVVGVGSQLIYNRNDMRSIALAQMPGNGQVGGFSWNGWGVGFTVIITNNTFRDIQGDMIGGFLDTPPGNNTPMIVNYFIRNNLFHNVLTSGYLNNRAPGTGKIVRVTYENNTVIFAPPTQIYANLIPIPALSYIPPTLQVIASNALTIENPTNGANSDTLFAINNIVIHPTNATFLNPRAITRSDGTDPATGLARRRGNILQASVPGISWGVPATVALPQNAFPRGISFPDHRTFGPNAAQGANLVGAANQNWPAIVQAPPSAPGAIMFTNITATSATGTWPASTTTGTILEYRPFFNAGASWLPLPFNSSLSRTLTGLPPNTIVQVAVRGVDNLGQEGDQSVQSFTTLPNPDVIPPTVPGAATFSLIQITTATLTTTGSTDNIGVTRYVFRVNNVPLADSTANLSRNLTGLTGNVNYNVTVQAVDAAGNRSVTSSTTSFTTLTAPPVTTTTVSRTGQNVVQIIGPNRTISMHKTQFVFDHSNGVFTLYPPGVPTVRIALADLLPGQANIPAAILYLQSLIE